MSFCFVNKTSTVRLYLWFKNKTNIGSRAEHKQSTGHQPRHRSGYGQREAATFRRQIIWRDCISRDPIWSIDSGRIQFIPPLGDHAGVHLSSGVHRRSRIAHMDFSACTDSARPATSFRTASSLSSLRATGTFFMNRAVTRLNRAPLPPMDLSSATTPVSIRSSTNSGPHNSRYCLIRSTTPLTKVKGIGLAI